jgi:hypothetical protein
LIRKPVERIMLGRKATRKERLNLLKMVLKIISLKYLIP